MAQAGRTASAGGKTIGSKMTRSSWELTLRLTVAVLLCVSLHSHAIGLSDLLDRASQLSDRLHSLSASLTNDLDSYFSPVGHVMMPRPSMCHTSALQTPSDKDQALRVPESELLSLIRSLLLSWSDPLLLLSLEAPTLPHPSNNAIHSKTKELQDNMQNLNSGLERLVHKVSATWRMGVVGGGGELGCLSLSLCDRVLSSLLQIGYKSPTFLPFKGHELSDDKISRLTYFHFLLSCFRRDSHKIDSFLKVLRCREARMRPEFC
uniref:Prolactin n=1 Tax=Scleropages formosus TaxID=113540 RepID=A0A8C9R8G1_SCLFO